MALGSARSLRIATDVGGTFTDIVGFDEGSGAAFFGKTLTTPTNLVDGIVTGVAKAQAEIGKARLFLHGTTVAINAILERKGARTALLTTRGFRDVYEIGRINRPDAYNLFFEKHVPLVPRSLRWEVPERIGARGQVLWPLDEEAVLEFCDRIRDQGIEAVAILFLHSYANPAHELRVKALVQQHCPGVFVTASHEVSQEYREFERTSTIAANAYVGPLVRNYLGGIDQRLETLGFGGSFFVMQSNGGLFDAARAQRECIHMLESGPAAGVIGGKAVCARLGLADAISFDMGGTTAKAGVVLGGEVMMAGSIMIGGYTRGLPIQIPLIDVQEVGTGGGSIAFVEPGGGLRVGPESAGAAPGPVCYGLGGTEPTVTDANLVLGRLAPDRFLGGEMPLDVAAAEAALQARVAGPLGISLTDAANGIIRIAASTMSHVVTRVTTERGLDAGDFAMVAYGGAGPLHAGLVARELRIPTVIIPPAPGHFSAYGMLMADLRRDFVRTWFRPLSELKFEEMEALYAELEAEGRALLAPDIEAGGEILCTRGADMRYVGQEHPCHVPLPAHVFAGQDAAQIKQAFDEEHLRRYGFDAVREPAEIVSLTSTVIGLLSKPVAAKLAGQGEADPARALSQRRPVFFTETGFVETPIFDRTRLLPGDHFTGPALVEEHASTTVVFPGDQLRVTEYGDLAITIARS